MRVLVTRPEPGGARTAARLVQAGHDPVLLPLFETRVTASPQDLPPADRIGGLIATSARAFALFETGDLRDTAFLDVPVHAVGPATARAAQRVGFRDIHEGAGTASDLTQALIGRQAHPDRGAGGYGPDGGGLALVYLAGVPRTPAIEEALDDAGVLFSVVACYEMT
ncbi:MAG: uroporphyrinogen-III synthase [Hoeflea sp.]|nr:uroporphyrinogen-III synthase [Hoeflea sp.]